MTKEKFFGSMGWAGMVTSGRTQGHVYTAVYGRHKLYAVGGIRILQE